MSRLQRMLSSFTRGVRNCTHSSWHYTDSGSAEKKNQELLDKLIEKINVTQGVYIFVEPQPAVFKKLKKIPGALIFTSSK